MQRRPAADVYVRLHASMGIRDRSNILKLFFWPNYQQKIKERGGTGVTSISDRSG